VAAHGHFTDRGAPCLTVGSADTRHARAWHTECMPKRSSSTDSNVLAAAIVRAATNGDKNPAAVMLGRMGGLKGGKARAASLSAKRRSEIAKNAARARWKNGQ
jgi:hypothetical protein